MDTLGRLFDILKYFSYFSGKMRSDISCRLSPKSVCRLLNTTQRVIKIYMREHTSITKTCLFKYIEKNTILKNGNFQIKKF